MEMDTLLKNVILRVAIALHIGTCSFHCE